MNTHRLKTISQYFKDIRSGIKTFEVRFNDRNYQVGDILVLDEVISIDAIYYTGEIEYRRVTYVLDNPEYCKEGFVILGLEKFKWPGKQEGENE